MSTNTTNNVNNNNNINTEQRGESGMNSNNLDKKEFKEQIRRQYDKGWMYIIIGIAIIMIGIYLSAVVSTPDFPEKQPVKLELPPPNLPPLLEPEKLDPQKILKEAVTPAITECEKKNGEVLGKCLDTLDQLLQKSYAGIDPFLEDLTSFGTKAGITWNWVAGDKEAYVRNKYEQYILSEKKLDEIMKDVVQQYIMGVGANINEMYLRIRTDIKPIIKRFDITENEVTNFVQKTFRDLLIDMQYSSDELLMSTIISYGASELGSVIAVRGGTIVLGAVTAQLSSALATVSQSILVPALSMAGVNLGGTLAGTGGGVAASTATGASVGSVVPGLGTVIGFLVGAVVGYFVEEHMDNNFRESMKPQIVKSLDSVKENIKNSFEKYVTDSEKQFMVTLNSSFYKEIQTFCDEQNTIRYNEYLRKKQALEAQKAMYLQCVQQNRYQVPEEKRIL